jgi:hypothetical protein
VGTTAGDLPSRIELEVVSLTDLFGRRAALDDPAYCIESAMREVFSRRRQG